MFRVQHDRFGGTLALLVFVARADFAAAATPIELTGETMGTSYSVKLAQSPTGVTTRELKAQIDARLEAINDEMSTYRSESELSRFNRLSGTDWFPVSADTALVVAAALEVSQHSNGAFDVTVGPLVDLWNFGPQAGEFQVPSEDRIHETMARVGFRNVALRRDPPALRKTRADVQLDLSAIAPGFAVDVVAGLLQSHGVSGFLVEIGGEMRCRGTKADGTAWRVGIEAPIENQRRIQKVISLGDQAIATSGNYRHFFEKDGKRYAHTIDPHTGRPVEHALASVSVICESCMDADAAATAIMVLGPDDGYNFAVRQGLAALLIVHGRHGFVEKPTPKFRAAFEPKHAAN